MANTRVVVRPTETDALKCANEYIASMTKAMNSILRDPTGLHAHGARLLMADDGFKEAPIIMFAAENQPDNPTIAIQFGEYLDRITGGESSR